MKDVFDILNRFNVPHVLDVATGRGEFINVLKQKLGYYEQIIGVDPSGKNVNYAQKIYPENNIEIYRMELEELQFPDNSFDLVSISNSLHHLEDREKVFAQILRVAKPGGIVLVTEMYKDGEQTAAQQTHIMIHHWIAAIDRRLDIIHDETFDKAEIIEMVKGLKLENLQVVDFYVPVEDPRQSAYCQSLKNTCQSNLKRIANLEDAQDLRDQGQVILKRLDEIGCAGASRLLAWGTKNK